MASLGTTMGTTRLRWGLGGDNDGVAFVGRQRIWLAAWGRGSVVGGTKAVGGKGCAAPRVARDLCCEQRTEPLFCVIRYKYMCVWPRGRRHLF